MDKQGLAKSKRANKIRLYKILYNISRVETGIQYIRITKIWPNTDWNTVWKNLHYTPIPGGKKAVWYKVINDILPTNERLHKIRVSPADTCSNCGMHDKLQHRLTECGEGPQIWQWTTQDLARILRTIPTLIPGDWLLRPQCALWALTTQRAACGSLANVEIFRTRPNREHTLCDFIEFLQANKYKLYQTRQRRLLVANYLCVLDIP